MHTALTPPLQVCDFNLSKVLVDDSAQDSSVAAGNPRWLAPEVLSGEQHSFASDVYSFGLVLWGKLLQHTT